MTPQVMADYEIVPGTIYLIDVLENDSGLAHARSRSKNVLLVPQPSEDPYDPLRWATVKKAIFIGTLWTYTFLLGGITLATSTVFVDILEAIGSTSLLMNAGSAIQLFFLGIGNVLCIPLTHKFGRRPVYLATMIVLLCSEILQMFMKNEAQYLGGCILVGLGAAPFDVLVNISLADISFAHYRGTLIALISLAASWGSYLGPLWQGYMATGQGDWRWIMRWGAIFCGFMLLLMFLFLEESLFRRSLVQREVDYSAASVIENVTEAGLGTEDKAPSNENSLVRSTTTPRSYISKLAPYGTFPIGWDIVFRKIVAGVTSMTYPAVLWGGLVYGMLISWLVVMATTEAEFFSLPPYNFNAAQVGNLSIAPFIGSICGLFISGFLNDRIFIHLSRNNSGFAEPEFRLWILLPISLLQATGLLLYGLGLAHSMPWIVPAVGMGFNGFCIVSSISVIVSYVIDCYKDIAEEAITSVLLIRALFSTGFTFAIQPWITHSGLENTFIAMAMIAFTGLFSAAVFIRWGKSFRRMTAQRYIAASLETLQLPHVTNT